MGIAERFFAAARRHPGRPALVAAGTVIPYEALAARVLDRAARLTTPGTATAAAPGGRRLAIDFDNSPDCVERFLAAAAAGITVLTFDPKWSEHERHSMQAELLAPGRTVGDAASGIQGEGAGGRRPAVSPATPLFIGFTSGTTGRPKAYVRSHRSWLASLDHAAKELPVSDGERVLVAGPLAHSMFLFAALEALTAGATVHLHTRFDPGRVLDDIGASMITRLPLVPTMAAALAAADGRRRFASLRTVVSAGAKLSPTVRDAVAGAFPAGEIVEYYGASELSFVSIAHGREGHPPSSVGRPFHGVEIAIRDSDGREARPGAVGLLWVKSDMVCDGYLVGGGDGAGFRVVDGWATVGDLARRDDRGILYIAGRENGMIVSGGLNIYPAEVEMVLRGLPAVAEVAVVGLPDPYWGESLFAVLRLYEGAALTVSSVRAHCRAHLATFKCPRRFFATTAFPQTGSGKIDESALRTWLAAADPRLVELG